MIMNHRIIDITKYDSKDKSEVFVTLNEDDYQNPVSTLKRIRNNPDSFVKNETIIRVSQSQYKKFLEYLDRTNEFFLKDFGSIANAKFLLAFSFGENPEVNSQIAQLIFDTVKPSSLCGLYMQWEIALEFEKRIKGYNSFSVIPIKLNPGQKYMTTLDVANKFKNLSQVSKNDSVFVVGQSWHGLSYIAVCKEINIKVIGGRFINAFATNDEQDWVRNAFAWILKESTKNKNISL